MYSAFPSFHNQYNSFSIYNKHKIILQVYCNLNSVQTTSEYMCMALGFSFKNNSVERNLPDLTNIFQFLRKLGTFYFEAY